MNEKHLKLFTLCSERLPERNIQTSVLLNNTERIGSYSLELGWKILDDGGEGWIPESAYMSNGERVIEIVVTHWQDKDSLCTKEAALKLAEEARKEGYQAAIDQRHMDEFGV